MKTFALLEVFARGITSDGQLIDCEVEVIGHWNHIDVANAERAIMERLNPERTFKVVVLSSARNPMRHE